MALPEASSRGGGLSWFQDWDEFLQEVKDDPDGLRDHTFYMPLGDKAVYTAWTVDRWIVVLTGSHGPYKSPPSLDGPEIPRWLFQNLPTPRVTDG